MTIELTPANWRTYERCIRNYEGHSDAYFDIATEKVYIDGKPATTYTFDMDYYFMMGDNRNYSADSRSWQNTFVKKEKIIAKSTVPLFPKYRKD